MAHRQLQHSLERLSAAADAQQPAAEAVRRLSGDISACIDKVIKLRAAQLVQLRVPYHLGRIALLPLRVLAAAETELPNVDADVLFTLHEVCVANVSVASTCKAADHEPVLPPELVTAWTAAARKVVAHLQQQHPRRPGGSRQQGRSIPSAVQQLLQTLLLLWHTMFTSPPYTKPLACNAAAACASDAAELAVLLLTCTSEAEAAQQSESRFYDEQGEAAFALHVLADCLQEKGNEVVADAGSCSPGRHTLSLVSDSVQEALALHLAILLAGHHNQRAAGRRRRRSSSSSSSSIANSLLAAASHTWLQSAGFLRGHHARWYVDHICVSFMSSSQQPAGSSSSSRHNSAAEAPPCQIQVTAVAALRQVVLARAAAVCRPGWQQRCRGLIAAADTSVDPVPLDGIELLPLLPEAVRCDGRQYAPGVCAALLQRLIIEAAGVCCCGGPDGASSFCAAMNLVTFFLQLTTPTDLDPGTAAAVLPPLWLGLGQALLAASDAAASEGQQNVGGMGHQQAAGTGVRQQVGFAAPPQGLEQQSTTAAAAKQQWLQQMWGRYSTTLFMTIHWLDTVYDVQRPMEVYMEQQEELSGRVLEAAVRASRELGATADGISAHVGIQRDVLYGMTLALYSCLPRCQLPAATQRELYTRPSRGSRCCSLLVSVAKELEGRAAAAPSIGACLLPNLCGVATASTPPIYELAEQLWKGSATPEDLPFLAGPGSTAWLFAAGRMLVTVGRLLQQVPAWCTAPLTRPMLGNLVQLVSFVMWLDRIEALLGVIKHQLEGVGQPGATPAAAAATSIKAVAAAEAKVAALGQAHSPLFDQLMDVAMPQEWRQISSLQLSAALGALSAACTPQGGLPAALEAVGASLCAAFPQRYACNNPACGSTEGLSEAACAKNKCSACKVARYCCKEHQLSHWPDHRRVCKHLHTLLPATGAATTAAAAAAAAAAGGKAPTT